jgi:hypothetical protein
MFDRSSLFIQKTILYILSIKYALHPKGRSAPWYHPRLPCAANMPHKTSNPLYRAGPSPTTEHPSDAFTGEAPGRTLLVFRLCAPFSAGGGALFCAQGGYDFPHQSLY